uniref:Uncharacterized protein n=1 Tax=Anguilla anguilla TaxID=7936 RepID=A0A0E9RWB9_ANGAN
MHGLEVERGGIFGPDKLEDDGTFCQDPFHALRCWVLQVSTWTSMICPFPVGVPCSR